MNIKYALFYFCTISTIIIQANPLHDAIIHEDIPQIRKILTSKTVNVNEQDTNNGNTLLHMVIGAEQGYDIAKLLIESGADVNIQENHDGNTPLHELVLLLSYSDFDDYDENERAEYIDPCIKLMHLLIQSNSNLYLRNHRDETPLLTAMMYKSYIAAKILLEYPQKLDINAQDDGYVTALDIAAIDNAAEMAQLIIQAGADINNCNNPEHVTALHQAVIGDAFDVAQLLIKSGANTAIKDKLGLTPQQYCKNQKMRSLFTKK